MFGKKFKHSFQFYHDHPDLFLEEFFGMKLDKIQKRKLQYLPLVDGWNDICKVTRCKDCIYWVSWVMYDKNNTKVAEHSGCNLGHKGDGNLYYCSYGKKRSNSETH